MSVNNNKKNTHIYNIINNPPKAFTEPCECCGVSEFYLGVKHAEERIIKLLENPYYHHTFLGPRDVNDEPVILHDGECIGCVAISEIKGEQK